MEETCADSNNGDHICERNYEDVFELSSNTVDSRYTCGGCNMKLRTICRLHKHLLKEFLHGSYLYDHATKTAYPKQISATVETQTEVRDFVKLEIEGNNLLGVSDIDKGNIVIENTQKIPQGEADGQTSHKRKRKSARRKEVNLDIVLEKKKVKYTKNSQNKTKPVKEGVESRYSGKGESLSPDNVKYNVKEETETLIYDNESTDDNVDLDNVPEEKQKTNDEENSEHVRKSMNNYENKRSKTGRQQSKIKHRKKTKFVNTKPENSVKDCSDKEILDEFCDGDLVIANSVTEKRKSEHPKFEKEKINCQHCDNQFSSLKRFNAHLQSVHKCIYPFSCKQCNRKPFKNKEEYLEHKKLHPKQIFRCDLCEKELKSREGLRLHELIHSGEKPFSCDKCDYRGRTSTQLRQHMYNHTDTKTEQCEHCGKAFFTKGKLKEHLRYCRKEFNHHCQHCQKGFPTASGLRKHVLMHTGERAFVCDVCGFATFRITLLNSHMRIHTGEKPHKCKECGAFLATRGTLLLHLRTHTHEKPFVCSYCSKAFTSKWNLQTHLRQHTGETPYKCDICGQGFKQNVLRKAHMRSHLESTSTEPAVHTHVDPAHEIHITSQLDTNSSERVIHSHMDQSNTLEPGNLPVNRLEPNKSFMNNFVYGRPGTEDILHQALQSENIHPLDLKLHYSTAEDLKNAFNTSVINSHQQVQSNTFEMINYQDIKHV